MTKSSVRTLLCAALLLAVGCSTIRTTPQDEQLRRMVDLNERALASAEKGQRSDATKLLQDSWRLAIALDDQPMQIMTLLNQSRLARRNHDLAESRTYLDKALHISGQQGPLFADLAQEQALWALAAGDLTEAQRWATAAHRAEEGSQLGRRLNLLARVALLRGQRSEAKTLAEQALANNKTVGQELERANSLRTLGIIATQEGDWIAAEEQLQAALTLDRQQAAPHRIISDLEALAELAGRQQQTERQQEYLQRARMAREQLANSAKKSE
ncbi:MAG: hypothetical protein FIA89_16510 [Geobacter sp.]|nr:hypothetical protein [Geobacter sp.]